MIKLFVILGLLLSVMSCSKSNKHKTAIPEGWKSFEGNEYTINYPKTWELNTSGQTGANLLLFSQPDSEEDQFKENISLLIHDLGGLNMNLNKYVEALEAQVSVIVTNGVVLESKRINSDTGDYQSIISTGKQGIFSLKYKQYCFVNNEKAYILTFTSEQSQFENYKSIGKEIMDSFTINQSLNSLF